MTENVEWDYFSFAYNLVTNIFWAGILVMGFFYLPATMSENVTPRPVFAFILFIGVVFALDILRGL